MEVKQIYDILNSVTTEIIGKSDLVKEDLTNVVEIGTEVFNASAIDNYVKSLVNHIGKVVFVNRPYSGGVPSILMSTWEFGSILEKISADIPEATENDTWNLTNGQSYDTNVFYKPAVSAKFFNSRVTFEIPMSFTEKQVKESFTSAAQLNGFMSMLYNAVEKSMTIKIDSLVMRTINNMTAQTLAAEFPTAGYGAKSTVKAVNLLYEYNTENKTTLKVADCIKNPNFIKYASYRMGLYSDRMKKISTLFNIGAKDRFTPADKMVVVMLADFRNACGVYLQSDTFHDNYVALPNAETVPYWQGSGESYAFEDVSKIHVNTQGNSAGIEVNASGILAVMFDKDACGVCNSSRRVTTSYNAKGEFFNNYYKFDAGYFNDTNENFVVFFVADAT